MVESNEIIETMCCNDNGSKSQCSGGSCKETSDECMSINKDKTPQANKSILKQYVCYSCTISVDKMDSIPHYVLSDLNQLIHRQEMEEQIKDFLL